MDGKLIFLNELKLIYNSVKLPVWNFLSIHESRDCHTDHQHHHNSELQL